MTAQGQRPRLPPLERANGGRLLGRSPELAARRSLSAIDAWSTSQAASAVQLMAFDDALEDLHDGVAVANHDVWGDPLPAHLSGGALQLRERMGERQRSERDPQAVAAAGTRGPGGELPHLERIQTAFGTHDVSGVRAHVGGPASAASAELGAIAYAQGDAIGFASAPDLHTAAHEAAHIVQQRAGVQLAGGVGQAGDHYERHADRVADGVVRGEDVSALLGPVAVGGGGRVVQREASGAPVVGGVESKLTHKEAKVAAAGSISSEQAEGKVEITILDPSNCKVVVPIYGNPLAPIVGLELNAGVKFSMGARQKWATAKRGPESSVTVGLRGEAQVMLKANALKAVTFYAGGVLKLEGNNMELTRSAAGKWTAKPMSLAAKGDVRIGVELKAGIPQAKLSLSMKKELRSRAADLFTLCLGAYEQGKVPKVTAEPGADLIAFTEWARHVLGVERAAAPTEPDLEGEVADEDALGMSVESYPAGAPVAGVEPADLIDPSAPVAAAKAPKAKAPKAPVQRKETPKAPPAVQPSADRIAEGHDGYVYALAADGTITIKRGPSLVGKRFAPGTPVHAAITREVGTYAVPVAVPLAPRQVHHVPPRVPSPAYLDNNPPKVTPTAGRLDALTPPNVRPKAPRTNGPGDVDAPFRDPLGRDANAPDRGTGLGTIGKAPGIKFGAGPAPSTSPELPKRPAPNVPPEPGIPEPASEPAEAPLEMEHPLAGGSNRA